MQSTTAVEQELVMIGIFPSCEPPDKSQMNIQGYALKSPFMFCVYFRYHFYSI